MEDAMTIAARIRLVETGPISCINLRRETATLPGIAAFSRRVLNFPILT